MVCAASTIKSHGSRRFTTGEASESVVPLPFNLETQNMRKLIISAFAGVSLLAAAPAANACIQIPIDGGTIITHCQWMPNGSEGWIRR
jgi:hypothetical protein